MTTPTTATTPAPPGEKPRAVVSQANKPAFSISPKRSFSDRWLKMLVYGSFGTGKSTLAASSVDVAHMRDVLMIDAESGDMVLHENPRIKDWENVEHIRVTTFMQVAQIQEYLKGHCTARDRNDIDKLRQTEAYLKGVDPSEIETPRQFRTVIIDSLTEIDAYCMYGLMKVDTSKIMTGAADDVDVAQWDEFRKNNLMMQTLVRALRDLPMNVIFVCSQQYNQDEMKRFHYAPQLTGKLAKQVQGFVDVVGALRTAQTDANGEAPRRLYVQPVDRYDAKNRRPRFKEPFLENPTMSTLMKAFGL